MEPKFCKLDKILAPFDKKIERKLKDIKNLFMDEEKAEELDQGMIIYEVYEMENFDINCALTLLYPGKVGKEYFMTKGHYHEKEEGEIYFCLSGEGILLMRDREGKIKDIKLEKGVVAYVPPEHAHRVVNTGNEILSFLAFYSRYAGHDYKSIEKEGFGAVVIEEEGKPVIKRGDLK